MKSIFLVSLSIGFLGCAHQKVEERRHVASHNCLETRAAFDVGSATTRLMVAEVDACEQRIVKVLRKEDRSVGYKDDLEKRRAVEFSEEIQLRGLRIFTELRTIANSEGATHYAGTATSAFRAAKNAGDYVGRIKAQTGVALFIIEQQTEAQMGFLAAINEPSVDSNAVVVWDIGGGSQQFSAREQSEMKTSLVELGSVGFKNEVLRQLQPEKPLSASPNPIGVENYERVVSLAKQHALQHTTADVRALLERRQVIGIGSVHAQSILRQTRQTKAYDQSQVENALRERLAFTDTQIGSPFAASDVTNLALVYGYMQALGIQSVRHLSVNLTNGTVLYPPFWQEGRR